MQKTDKASVKRRPSSVAASDDGGKSCFIFEC